MHRRAYPFAFVALCCSSSSCAPPAEVVETPVVRVVGLDYTFALPDSLPAGPVRIEFDNRGEVRHELVLLRLRSDVEFSAAMEGMGSGADPADFFDGFGGVLIAEPGETAWGRLSLGLDVGRTYVLLCNFTDTDDAPPHSDLGMLMPFSVSG